MRMLAVALTDQLPVSEETATSNGGHEARWSIGTEAVTADTSRDASMGSWGHAGLRGLAW